MKGRHTSGWSRRRPRRRRPRRQWPQPRRHPLPESLPRRPCRGAALGPRVPSLLRSAAAGSRQRPPPHALVTCGARAHLLYAPRNSSRRRRTRFVGRPAPAKRRSGRPALARRATDRAADSARPAVLRDLATHLTVMLPWRLPAGEAPRARAPRMRARGDRAAASRPMSGGQRAGS